MKIQYDSEVDALYIEVQASGIEALQKTGS